MSTAEATTRTPTAVIEAAMMRRLAAGDVKAAVNADDLLDEVKASIADGFGSSFKKTIAAGDEAIRLLRVMMGVKKDIKPEAFDAVADVFVKAVVAAWLVTRVMLSVEKEATYLTFLAREYPLMPGDELQRVLTRIREGLEELKGEESLPKIYQFLAEMMPRNDHGGIIRALGRSLGQYAPGRELKLAATVLRAIHRSTDQDPWHPDAHDLAIPFLAKEALSIMEIADLAFQMVSQCDFSLRPIITLEKRGTITLTWQEIDEFKKGEEERLKRELDEVEAKIRDWWARYHFPPDHQIELKYRIQHPERSGDKLEVSRTIANTSRC